MIRSVCNGFEHPSWPLLVSPESAHVYRHICFYCESCYLFTRVQAADLPDIAWS